MHPLPVHPFCQALGMVSNQLAQITPDHRLVLQGVGCVAQKAIGRGAGALIHGVTEIGGMTNGWASKCGGSSPNAGHMVGRPAKVPS